MYKRQLYDLFVDWVKEGKDLDDNRPHQYELNKLNLSYTLMSKRNLLTLVKEGLDVYKRQSHIIGTVTLTGCH